MVCDSKWEFTLKRSDGTIDFDPDSGGRVQLSEENPTLHVISGVVLDTLDNPIENTRRRGVCRPEGPGVRRLVLVIKHPHTSGNFIVVGDISETSSPATFSGMYVAPDTGDTGTGTGSQTVTIAVTSREGQA